MIIFGYDNFPSFDSGTDVDSFDLDNINNNAFSPLHSINTISIVNALKIENMNINMIDSKYFYPIEVDSHNFWENDSYKNPNINTIVLDDIKKGKCKILLLFSSEWVEGSKRVSGLLNIWITRFNLPYNSIVLIGGSPEYEKELKNHRYIKYIPFSIWEYWSHTSFSYDIDLNGFKDAIINRKNRKKIFLSYNRRLKYHRWKLATDLHKNDLLKFGLISLSDMDIESDKINTEDSNDPILNMLPISIDNIDLYNEFMPLVKKHFLDTYISIITESTYDKGSIFLTEKTTKSIFALHPFFIVASPGYLEYLRSIGYMTFSTWFNESYDLENNIDIRIGKIVNQIKELVKIPEHELQSILVDMLPTLIHNKINLKMRGNDKSLRTKLKKELNK